MCARVCGVCECMHVCVGGGGCVCVCVHLNSVVY